MWFAPHELHAICTPCAAQDLYPMCCTGFVPHVLHRICTSCVAQDLYPMSCTWFIPHELHVICTPYVAHDLYPMWGRNSLLVVFGFVVHSVAGSILLWGNFPVEGIFPLELTSVQTPFPPKNSFGWEYKPRFSLCTHAFHRTDSKDPDVHVLDGECRQQKHTQHAPSTKTKCDYLNGNKNKPSTHHPPRRNVTTLMATKTNPARTIHQDEMWLP